MMKLMLILALLVGVDMLEGAGMPFDILQKDSLTSVLRKKRSTDYGVLLNFPSNEYVFAVDRDALEEAEKKFENRDAKLSRDEHIVDHFLQYLKWREFNATRKTGFPPSRPTEKVVDYIKTTEIYKALKPLPKGGILHSHENAQLSKLRLFDIIWNSPDFQYLYMQSPSDPSNPWNVNFYLTPPSSGNWINVKTSSYTKEDLAKQQTMFALLTDKETNLPTDAGMRWALGNIAFNRGSSKVIANSKIKPLYLKAMYEQGLEEGITYWETRRSVGNLYELNPDPAYAKTYGQKALAGGIELDINVTKQVASDFVQAHPEFIGHKRIYYNTRQDATANIDNDVQTVINTMAKYPDHVLGWDLVGEEDAGNSLLYYIDNFIKLYDPATGKSKVPLYLHNAETDFLEDLITSTNNLDSVATLQNTYEALLLNSKRIGHGIGFVKHPLLLQMLRDRKVALEICVVSNQMLGYSPDIRNHPGQIFYRMGIPIALSADDPATFGYDEVTVDWYDAYMAWGLNLGDLKTLAINSLQYSGMTDAEKADAIENKWRPLWNNYIQTKKTEACSRNFATEASNEGRSVIFGQILPKEGAITGSTKVHIFGRNFEIGMCNNIVCQFGNKPPTKGFYISNQHIICESPAGSNQAETVTVSVNFDGTNLLSTGFTFSYKFAPLSAPHLFPETN